MFMRLFPGASENSYIFDSPGALHDGRIAFPGTFRIAHASRQGGIACAESGTVLEHFR